MQQRDLFRVFASSTGIYHLCCTTTCTGLTFYRAYQLQNERDCTSLLAGKSSEVSTKYANACKCRMCVCMWSLFAKSLAETCVHREKHKAAQYKKTKYRKMVNAIMKQRNDEGKWSYVCSVFVSCIFLALMNTFIRFQGWKFTDKTINNNNGIFK